jgi:glycosyltransferase involved in cell wall biosynthesis
MGSIEDTRQSAREGTYLFVLPWDLSAVGGVNQVVIGLYQGVEQFGRLAPRVLQVSWDTQQPEDSIDTAGRHITRCRVRSPVGPRWWPLDLARYLCTLPGELLRIRALVRRYDVRVVNCHYIGGVELSWLIARSLGVFRGKVLLSLHGLDIRTLARVRGLRRVMWRWALKRADAIVACSEGLAAETVREFGLPLEHVVTIHNGVDVARVARAVADAAAQAPAPNAQEPMLLNLGTLEHKKGHDVLLRAFARVIQRRPDARLQIMGRTGETKAATLALIDELRLNRHVSLTTDAPHVAALRALHSADIFVLSSRNEAFSVALLEAGALGKPVVATNVCGVPELIHDGETGIIVPAEDPEALAQGMLKLLEDRSFARECGRRLRERVQRQFTLENTSRNYLALAGYLAS